MATPKPPNRSRRRASPPPRPTPSTCWCSTTRRSPQRLTDLGERLRAAHAGMDGGRIRELTAEQRRLIDELVRTAFKESELNPTAALRDDVTTTLQAAIADPEVAARLGRLTKAEQWSGFGEFGDTAIVFKPTGGRKTKPEPKANSRRAPEAPRRQGRRGTSQAATGTRRTGRRRTRQGRGRRRTKGAAVRSRDGPASTRRRAQASEGRRKCAHRSRRRLRTSQAGQPRRRSRGEGSKGRYARQLISILSASRAGKLTLT